MHRQEHDNPGSSFTPTGPEKSKRPWFGIVITILVVLAAGGAFAVKTGRLPWAFGATQAAAKSPKYHCPMHPSVIYDKPGTCPICGMDLVPVGEGGHAEHAAPKSGVAGLAVVSITQQSRQVMGLKLGVVEKGKVAREVRTSARVVTDETRLWRVTTKTDGWVDKLFVSYAGQEVKKGDPLLTIYSPALVSAQAEYLTALKARGTMSGTGTNALIESSRKRLELWDISDEQIEKLTRTGKTEKYLTLYAPASGVVLTREVLAGQKISSGDPLMVIADLSVIWGDADIYQSDLPYVKVGMPLELSLPYWPGKVFEGKVIFVSPTLDGESRTLRARLEIPNKELLLKPGMYGDAKLLYEVGERLTIPASAVMLGGQHTYAFRDNGDNHLVPTEIKIGVRSGGSYELLGGLKEGDQVVVSANFLVDSESNLKSAMEALAPGVPAGEIAAQPEELSAKDYETAVSAYLKIHEALAADDLANAREAASALGAMTVASASQLASSKDISEARQQFRALSVTMIAATQKYGSPANLKLSVFNCPMAFDSKGADWIQRSGKTANPYFGKQMLGCGEEKGPVAANAPAPAH